MKFTLLLFCFLGTLICNGQGKSSRINYDTITINPNEKGVIKNGLMEGKWKGVDTEGKWKNTIYSELEWVNFFEKGYLKEKLVYVRGNIAYITFSKNDSIAVCNGFHKNGNIQSHIIFKYKKQKNDDIWPLIYGDNILDIVKDSSMFYYENGNLESIWTFKNKKVNGMIKMFYKNGKIWKSGNFSEGISEGKYTEYYENGKVKISGQYKNDEKVGKWTEYFENGKIKNTTDNSIQNNQSIKNLRRH